MLSLTWLKLTSTPLALGSAIQGVQVARVAAFASEGTRTRIARAIRATFTSLSIGASPYAKETSESGGPAMAERTPPAFGSLPCEPGFVPGIGECASKRQ